MLSLPKSVGLDHTVEKAYVEKLKRRAQEARDKAVAASEKNKGHSLPSTSFAPSRERWPQYERISKGVFEDMMYHRAYICSKANPTRNDPYVGSISFWNKG